MCSPSRVYVFSAARFCVFRLRVCFAFPFPVFILSRTRSASLKFEADLDATCLEKGWTPLMHASSRGNVNAIDALLAAGARVNQLSNPTGKVGK